MQIHMPTQWVEQYPCGKNRFDAAQNINPQKRAEPRKKSKKIVNEGFDRLLGRAYTPRPRRSRGAGLAGGVLSEPNG
jgi:hypothetical protein